MSQSLYETPPSSAPEIAGKRFGEVIAIPAFFVCGLVSSVFAILGVLPGTRKNK
jgi:hypothetical protein